MELLDIVFFQSGDFYGSDESILYKTLSLLIAILAALIPVFVFVGQLNTDRKKERNRRKREQVEKVKYLQVLIADTIPVIKKKIEQNNEQVCQLKTNPVECLAPKTVLKENITRLVKGLPHSDYYHAYIAELGKGRINEAIVEFKQIYGALDFFYYQIPELEKLITERHFANYDRSSLYIESHNVARHFLSNLRQEDLSNLSDLIEIIKRADDNRPQFAGVEYHYRNIDYLLIQELKKCTIVTEKRNEIYRLLKKAERCYNEIKEHNEEFARYLSRHNFQMKRVFINLKNYSRKLGEYQETKY